MPHTGGERNGDLNESIDFVLQYRRRHNSAARAIAEEMQERGDEAYVLDYL